MAPTATLLLLFSIVVALFAPACLAGTHAFISHSHAAAEAPPASAMLTVQLVLHPERASELQRAAAEITDPSHARYQQYLTVAQVTELVRPSAEALAAVRSFLRSTPHRFTANQDMVTVSLSVAQAETLFGCELRMFRHRSMLASAAADATDSAGGAASVSISRVRSKGIRAATPLRAVPESVARHLAFVGGLNSPIHHRRLRLRSDAKASSAPQAADVVALSQSAMFAAANGVVSPTIRFFSPSDSQATAVFRLTCANGSSNTDVLPAAPCSSQPPAVTRVQALVRQVGAPSNLIDFVPEQMGCTSFQCAVALSVRNYLDTSVSLRVEFVNGSVSAWSAFSDNVWPQPLALPAFLSQLYGIPPNTRAVQPRNIQSVAEFLDEYYNPDDLRNFQLDHGLPDQPMSQVRGPNNETIPGGEATLDVQYLMALAPGAPTWFWSVAGTNEYIHKEGFEPFITWLSQVNDVTDGPFPLVHSVSYGDTEDYIPANYSARVDAEFMKLAVRGVSVLISAGDNGASSVDDGTGAAHCATAHPEFPASSPWVISVGGTQNSIATSKFCDGNGGCAIVGERMCSGDRGGVITTGGGFSTLFAQPAYQGAAVASYLGSAEFAAAGLTPPYFNARGRAYPDVAAYASNFPIILDGRHTEEFGTSASAPVMAAMVTLWNDILLSQGKPPLGFLNPWLYKLAQEHPEAFNDITVGNNRCSTEGKPCCALGFPAARGWDAVSGVGSPRWDVIASILRRDATASSVAPAAAAADGIQSARTVSWVALAVSALAGAAGVWALVRTRNLQRSSPALLGVDDLDSGLKTPAAADPSATYRVMHN